MRPYQQQVLFFSGSMSWMNSVVLYWCNVRTEGSLKNRQSQGLHESTTAQGTTNRFKANLLGNKLDLPSLGHHGPAKKEEKAVKADRSFVASQ